MRVILLLSMAVATSAFGVNRPAVSTKSATQVFGMVEESEKTQQTLDNEAKANRWNEIRLLSDEEAEKQLSGEELETFKSYHADMKEDLSKMQDIAKMMLKSLEPPKVKAKGKKQRKRDAWAKKKAIAEVRAAA